MKEYMFHSDSGTLHDTRDSNWSEKPLRAKFSQLVTFPNSGADIRAAIRHGGHVWPGGYPVFAGMADGGALCFDCVKKELRELLQAMRTRYRGDSWLVSQFAVNWEDSELTCDHCSKAIESAYGES